MTLNVAMNLEKKKKAFANVSQTHTGGAAGRRKRSGVWSYPAEKGLEEKVLVWRKEGIKAAFLHTVCLGGQGLRHNET